MDEGFNSAANLRQAVLKFDAALAHLDNALDGAIAKFGQTPEPITNSPEDDKNSLILREELASANARNEEMNFAIVEARTALSSAIEDIRSILGNI